MPRFTCPALALRLIARRRHPAVTISASVIESVSASIRVSVGVRVRVSIRIISEFAKARAGQFKAWAGTDAKALRAAPGFRAPGQHPSQYPGQYPSQYPGQYPSQYPCQPPPVTRSRARRRTGPPQPPSPYPSQSPSYYPSQATGAGDAGRPARWRGSAPWRGARSPAAAAAAAARPAAPRPARCPAARPRCMKDGGGGGVNSGREPVRACIETSLERRSGD